ncbi:MAG: iron transporter [Oscillospiraceae bacterium]|nr:iron transporter [Oscillospiraceae bacterium]
MKKALALVLAMVMVFALVACGNSASTTQQDNTPAPAQESTTAAVETTEAAAPEGGFEEIEIWADEEVGFLNVNGVYFQPVPMSGGFENFENFNLHFEADVSALENNLGYGVGDWVPYMTVDYELTGKNSGEVVSGTFMPMNADDGNHYGANIFMGTADTYSVKLTFHSPAENGFLIHLDDETGPGGKLEDYQWPLVLELPDVWDYAPTEW